MSVLLITHALNDQNKDYGPFFATLKNNCEHWWHYFPTTWIVSTSLYGVNEYAHLLYPHMLKTDHLLIVRLTREHQGWLPKEAWDWLNGKIY